MTFLYRKIKFLKYLFPKIWRENLPLKIIFHQKCRFLGCSKLLRILYFEIFSTVKIFRKTADFCSKLSIFCKKWKNRFLVFWISWPSDPGIFLFWEMSIVLDSKKSNSNFGIHRKISKFMNLEKPREYKQCIYSKTGAWKD